MHLLTAPWYTLKFLYHQSSKPKSMQPFPYSLYIAEHRVILPGPVLIMIFFLLLNPLEYPVSLSPTPMAELSSIFLAQFGSYK